MGLPIRAVDIFRKTVGDLGGSADCFDSTTTNLIIINCNVLTVLSCTPLYLCISRAMFLPPILLLLPFVSAIPRAPTPPPTLPGKFVKFSDLASCPDLTPRAVPSRVDDVWVFTLRIKLTTQTTG